MELIISISNDEKAGALVEFLRVLDFVESIRTQGDDRILEMETPRLKIFLPWLVYGKNVPSLKSQSAHKLGPFDHDPL